MDYILKKSEKSRAEYKRLSYLIVDKFPNVSINNPNYRRTLSGPKIFKIIHETIFEDRKSQGYSEEGFLMKWKPQSTTENPKISFEPYWTNDLENFGSRLNINNKLVWKNLFRSKTENLYSITENLYSRTDSHVRTMFDLKKRNRFYWEKNINPDNENEDGWKIEVAEYTICKTIDDVLKHINLHKNSGIKWWFKPGIGTFGSGVFSCGGTEITDTPEHFTIDNIQIKR
eukprot:UN24548